MKRFACAVLCLLASWVVSGPSYATVAFDAWSNSAAEFTTTATWTHSPVGTPRGVICTVVQNDSTDEITGIDYGSLALTELTGSPACKTTGETDCVYGYFAGASIPTGNQTVSVNSAAGSLPKRAGCVTLTAAADTELIVVDATISSDAIVDPSVTLSLSGKTSFAMIAFYSGLGAITSITPLASWTDRLEHSFGSNSAGFYTFNTIGSSDVTCGWTQSSDDARAICVAVSEVAQLHCDRYILEAGTDRYLAENGTDIFVLEGFDAGQCPAGTSRMLTLMGVGS